jgi:hypothetical protein
VLVDYRTVTRRLPVIAKPAVRQHYRQHAPTEPGWGPRRWCSTTSRCALRRLLFECHSAGAGPRRRHPDDGFSVAQRSGRRLGRAHRSHARHRDRRPADAAEIRWVTGETTMLCAQTRCRVRVASLRHAAGCVLSKRPVLRVRREQTRDNMGDPMMLRMPNGQPK